MVLKMYKTNDKLKKIPVALLYCGGYLNAFFGFPYTESINASQYNIFYDWLCLIY